MIHNNDFKEWHNTNLITFMESFEEFSCTTYQKSNLHLYYQCVKELYDRFPKESRYQDRHYYFTENNSTGDNTYLDYLNWVRKTNIKK